MLLDEMLEKSKQVKLEQMHYTHERDKLKTERIYEHARKQLLFIAYKEGRDPEDVMKLCGMVTAALQMEWTQFLDLLYSYHLLEPILEQEKEKKGKNHE